MLALAEKPQASSKTNNRRDCAKTATPKRRALPRINARTQLETSSFSGFG